MLNTALFDAPWYRIKHGS